MTGKINDPADRFSQPTYVKKTKLGRLMEFESRENPDKPGRSLRVIFDNRFPLVENFRPEYAYTVTFEKAGNMAGNHYHRAKSELVYPISGEFEIHLERISDKVSEIISLTSNRHEVLYIEAGIAHKVVAKSARAVLLVVATAPNIEEDSFRYETA